MTRVTDIWFRSNLDLETLVAGLALRDTEFDAENYWEWALGTFRNLRLDVTRTHTVPAEQTDTRIFIESGAEAFDPSTADAVIAQLHALNINPVYLGTWINERGNDYKKQITEKRTKA